MSKNSNIVDLALINIDKNMVDAENIIFASKVQMKMAIFDVMYIKKCSAKRVSLFKKGTCFEFKTGEYTPVLKSGTRVVKLLPVAKLFFDIF